MVPSSQKDDFFSHLELAKISLDSGDLDRALEHAQIAYKINPKSEDAANSLGFVYLSLAGADALSIIDKLLANSTSTSSSTATDTSTSTAQSTSNKSGANQLSTLKGAFGITSDEYRFLGVFDTTIPSLPVIQPSCANHARAAVQKLAYVNLAIKTICSYVNPAIRIAGEKRHECEENPLSSRRSSTHLLWALAHMFEAVTFYSVITYATTASPKTNLELRVDSVQKINISDTKNIPTFISQTVSLAKLIAKILPTLESCSPTDPQTQLTALVNDLISVDRAFANIPGIPSEISKPIQNASAQINAIESKLSGSKAKVAQVQSLKSNFTETISKVLAQKFNTINTKSLSPAQIKQVCSSFKTIQGTSSSVPKVCKE